VAHDTASSLEDRSSLDGLLSWLSFCLPASVAVWRASSGVQWRADLPSMRDQGLTAIELGGSVSMVVTQATGLLPIGNQAFRAAVGSALALGLAALLIYRIGRRFMAGAALPPWMSALLASIAGVTAALSPSFQREATVGGGGVFAVMIALALLDCGMQLTAHDAPTLTPKATRGWLSVAALAGLGLAENLPVGVAALTTLIFMSASSGKRPPLRMLPLLSMLLVGVFGAAVAGVFLRPLSPGSWSDVAHAVSGISLTPMEVTATRKAALFVYLEDVGVVSLGLGALGLAASLFRERRRAWTCVLIVPLVVDLTYPLAAASSASSDPLAPLRALAMAAFAIAASVGVAEAIVYLRNLEVPMARTASVLMVVFHITVVAVTCEDAAFAADRSEHLAAEEWTDQALGAAPTNAALLVHSPELTWRLWAAQSLRGARPDVVIIPAPILRHGLVTANLLPSEPSVAQLLRDFALTGQASEYGLSLLADARPLLVELDHRWDKRIITHLAVDGPWLRYAPQVLGRSDRKVNKTHVLADEGRITIGIRAGVAPDGVTAAVVAKTLKEHTTALSMVGMGQTTVPLLDGVERLLARDPFVTSARLRLAYAQQGRSRRSIDMRDLLAFH
jgi:hypothetical protein